MDTQILKKRVAIVNTNANSLRLILSLTHGSRCWSQAPHTSPVFRHTTTCSGVPSSSTPGKMKKVRVKPPVLPVAPEYRVPLAPMSSSTSGQ